MAIELSPQLLLTAGSLLTVCAAILGAVAYTVRWMDRQKKQGGEIQALREHHYIQQHFADEELVNFLGKYSCKS